MEDSLEREGLRMLTKAGVKISVMSYKGWGGAHKHLCWWSPNATIFLSISAHVDASNNDFIYFFRLFLLLADICG